LHPYNFQQAGFDVNQPELVLLEVQSIAMDASKKNGVARFTDCAKFSNLAYDYQPQN
jgi:hypothetical protein